MKVVDIENIVRDSSNCGIINVNGEKHWVLRGKRNEFSKDLRIITIGKSEYLNDKLVFINGKYFVKKNYHKYGLKDGKRQWFKEGERTIKVGDEYYYNYKDLKSFKELYIDKYSDVQIGRGYGGKPVFHHFDLQMYGEHNNPGFKVVQDSYKEDKNSICRYSKFLENYTFGVEYETSSGYLPELICKDLSLLPVKDGSLPNNALEYITPVMKGELNHIREQCIWLDKFCKVDLNTSLHNHIGNLPQPKEFIVAFYVLYYRLQFEIQSISPACKKDFLSFADKKTKKDHCAFLPPLGLDFNLEFVEDGELLKEIVDEAFIRIWTFTNDGIDPNPDSNPTNRQHSKQGQAKWYYDNRYFIVNLVPYFFEDKRTIEFRYHHGTTNSTKVINWLLINIAILKFTENNIFDILEKNKKITLLNVLEELNDPSLVAYLQSYVKNLSKTVTEDLKSGDKCGLIHRDKIPIKEWMN